MAFNEKQTMAAWKKRLKKEDDSMLGSVFTGIVIFGATYLMLLV